MKIVNPVTARLGIEIATDVLLGTSATASSPGARSAMMITMGLVAEIDGMRGPMIARAMIVITGVTAACGGHRAAPTPAPVPVVQRRGHIPGPPLSGSIMAFSPSNQNCGLIDRTRELIDGPHPLPHGVAGAVIHVHPIHVHPTLVKGPTPAGADLTTDEHGWFAADLRPVFIA